MRQIGVITTVLTVLIGASANAEISSQKSGRGLFISIDGLNPHYVEAMNDAGMLSGGFSQLMSKAARSSDVAPIVTTLTAPSHVSTITCTPPSVHGVVANSFLIDGVKVNGFTTPFQAEPMWITAMKQGKKVLALGYVGADGSSTERTATWGVAYPDGGLQSKSQTLDLAAEPTTDPVNWHQILAFPEWYYQTVKVILNPKTSQTVDVQLLVRSGQHGTVRVDEDLNPDNGMIAEISSSQVTADLFFQEAATETTAARKRRVFVRTLQAAEGRIKIYVSGSSYNNAYPAEFRQMLDDRNLVWPAYGMDSTATREEQFAGKTTLEDYLVEVGELALAELPLDIMLYYNPIIDTIGHGLQGVLPLPFNPQAQDDVTKTFVAAYGLVDRHLGRIFSKLDAGNDVIALMGDHGMAAASATVNVAAVWPEELRVSGSKHVVTSGAMILLYGDAQAEPVKSLIAGLEAAEWQGHRVAASVQYRDANQPWNYGQANAVIHATEKFWFEYSLADSNVFRVPPPATGMHGHLASSPDMKTGFFLQAPQVEAKRIGEMSLIDAVPSFLAQMGLVPSVQCQGKNLF
jgi:predicted AlkP superfamily pyrophosphatase or phosphodiesterase